MKVQLAIVVVVLATVGSCRFGFESKVELLDANNSDADDADDADGAAAGASLLVRYRIDEADSGQGPLELTDSAADPVDIPLFYSGASPRFDVGSGGGRHLVFSGTAGVDTGGARVGVEGTKMDALHGRRALTYEVKYAADDCLTEGRLFGVTTGTSGAADPVFVVRHFSGAETLTFKVIGESGFPYYRLQIASDMCPLSAASVVHWVLDLDNSTAADRVRAYVDGLRVQVRPTETFPAQGAQLDLASGTGELRMVVGAAHSGVRTLNGRIYYAALYTSVLSNSDIAANAEALMNSDDGN